MEIALYGLLTISVHAPAPLPVRRFLVKPQTVLNAQCWFLLVQKFTPPCVQWTKSGVCTVYMEERGFIRPSVLSEARSPAQRPGPGRSACSASPSGTSAQAGIPYPSIQDRLSFPV